LPILRSIATEGLSKFVANLWTEFAAQHGEALATNGKELQTLDFPRWLQLSKGQILNELPVV
jgi:hypothetical protein